MTSKEEKARFILSNATLADLFEEWELTTNIRTPEIAMIRGWILDELEKRNKDAFEKWLDGDAKDETLREYFTK